MATLKTRTLLENVSGTTLVYAFVDPDGGGEADGKLPLSTLVSEMDLATNTALTSGLSGKASTAQGALADSAVQPGDNVSDLTNDAGFISDAGDYFSTISVSGQTDVDATQSDDTLTLVAGSNVTISTSGKEITIAATGGGGGGGIASLVEDTTPQLGGDLDLNSNVITGMEIGTDIQAYSAVLAATTASFTTTLKDKLDGIDTGAEVNQTAQEIATAIDADATAENTLKTALGIPDGGFQDPADNLLTDLANDDVLPALDASAAEGSEVAGITRANFVSNVINPAADARIAAASLKDLTDVQDTAYTDGQVPSWSAANSRFEPGTGGGGSSTLAGLSDVDDSGVAIGDMLVRNAADDGYEFVTPITTEDLDDAVQDAEDAAAVAVAAAAELDPANWSEIS